MAKLTFDDALKRIDAIMGLTPHGIAKAQTFYDLARQVDTGCIVELGTYRGIGTLVLLAGARVPLFTVDDYASKTGWAGGHYGPEDEAQLRRTLDGVDGWTLVRGEVREMAAGWTEPAGLILWDLGVRERMMEDFWAWERHLLSGGTFALRDIDNQGLGSDAVVYSALTSGRYLATEAWPGYIWSVRKR